MHEKQFIEGTCIPAYSERGVIIMVLRRAAPNQTVEELKTSGLFEVRFNDAPLYNKGYELVRTRDGFAVSAPMGSPEKAWLSAEQIAQGKPGYYQPPYFCEQAGGLVWETWERLHEAIDRSGQ